MVAQCKNLLVAPILALSSVFSLQPSDFSLQPAYHFSLN